MSKAIIYTAVGLLVAVLALGWRLSVVSSDLTETKLEVKHLGTVVEADRTSTKRRAEAEAKARIKKAETDEADRKALEANPEWANQPIPDDIVDALRM